METSTINITDIICQAYHYIDPRLNSHGERVAYILMEMFKDKSQFSPQEKQNIFMLGLLHDIGAYKEAEIDSMLSFDQNDSLEHSVFGYLLFQTFSPLKEYANVILYHHHCNAQYYSVPISDYHRKLARILYLADRIDIFCQFNDSRHLLPFLEGYRDSIFASSDIQWFQNADSAYHILDALHSGSYRNELSKYMATLTFTEAEIHDFLLLFIFAIDFRSEYSALHTAYAVQISQKLAKELHFSGTSCKIAELSALLHNIGKISLPSFAKSSKDYDAYLKNIYSDSTQEITKKILTGNVQEPILETIHQSFSILDHWKQEKPLNFSPTPVAEVVALSCFLSNTLSLDSDLDMAHHESLLSFLHNKYRNCAMSDKILSSLERQYQQVIHEVKISCSSLSNTYKHMMNEYHSLNVVLLHYNQKYL